MSSKAPTSKESKAPTSKEEMKAPESLEAPEAPAIVHYLALSLVFASPKRSNITQIHGLDLYRARLEDGKAFVSCEKNYYDTENSQGSIDRLRTRLGNLASIIKGASDQIQSERDMIAGAKNAGLADHVVAEVVAAHEAAIAQHETVLNPALAEKEQIEAEIAVYQARIDSRKTLEWVLELPE